MLKSIVPLLMVTALAGCSGSEAVTSPTAPSFTTTIPPVSTAQNIALQLRGFVADTAFRPLAGARVEVVDGPSAGVTAIAAPDGQFVLQGRFDAATQFRAVKEGYETRTQTWNCSVAVCLGANNAQPWLGFNLSVHEPTVNIAGDYTLTFTADSACADLPDIARARSYGAAVTAQPTAGRSTIPGFDLKVRGARFIGILDGFTIGVAGNHLSFSLHGRHDPVILEDLGANAYLGFSGTAAAVATDGMPSITASFDGWIEYVELTSPIGPWYEFPPGAVIKKATCDSSTHRITLTRAK